MYINVYIFTLAHFLTRSKRMRKEKNRPWPRPAGLRWRSQVRGSANTQVRSRALVTGGEKPQVSQVSGQGVPETWDLTWDLTGDDSLNFIFNIFKFLVCCGKFCCTLIYHSYRNNLPHGKLELQSWPRVNGEPFRAFSAAGFFLTSWYGQK